MLQRQKTNIQHTSFLQDIMVYRLSHLPNTQKVPGSIPGEVITFIIKELFGINSEHIECGSVNKSSFN